MAWYNPSWLKRKQITIQQSQVDADLTDYPVMVSLADADILASASVDMRDVLFTSADETTKLSHELVKRRLVSPGGWSWFTNPRAIYYAGTHERTYIGTITGGLGSLYVTQYTHTTGAVVSTLLTSALEVDDHDHPSLIVRPSDSKLVAFYAKHSVDTSLRYKISTNAEDATAWGSELTTTYSGNVTYANPIILPDDGNACYVFSRIRDALNDYSWRYKRTADYSTWGAEVEIWDGGATQSYVHVARNGNGRIDFFASDMHPDNDAGGSSLYHFYAAWDSGSSSLKWYNSAGTEQTLPMTPANATIVYDGSGGNDGWNHQIAIDGSGYPRVLFQKRVSTSGAGDMRCMFARWNGSAWTTPVEIAAHGGYVYSGEISYTGGSCFDGNDTNKVYLGQQVSGIYEIQEWTTSDSGATWGKTRDITSGSSAGTQNMRPFSPLGHPVRMACLWGAGTYTTYISYNLGTYCDPPLATEAYVKVPSVSGTVDTDIYVYYGNSAAADQESATGAWNSGYKAVFHLEQSPSKTTLADSTINSVAATKKSYGEPGAVNTGQQFDGVDDYITLGSAINMAGWTAATIEALINYDGLGNSGDEHQVFSNWQTTNTQAAVMLRIEPTSGGRGLEGFAVRQTDTQVGGSFGLAVTANQDEFVGMVYDSTSLRGYLNSAEGGTTFSTGAAFDAGASLTAYIGNTPHITTEGFGGTMYEIRISDVARSAAWMKATSINLKTPTSFYVVGAETTDSPASGTGALSATESGSDTASLSGAVLVQGYLSAPETGSDTASMAGAVMVRGALAATESGSDTASFVASAPTIATGTLAATEAGSDTAFLNGSSVVIATGTMAGIESGQDSASMAGHVLVLGELAAFEVDVDTASFSGSALLGISGVLAAAETGFDTASFIQSQQVAVLSVARSTYSNTQNARRSNTQTARRP